jgi:hypothetical protein
MPTKCERLFRKSKSLFGLSVAAVLCGLSASVGSASAQEMKNPSFETPEIVGSDGKPFLMAPSEVLKASGWDWGYFTGICRQHEGFAKGLYAHEGSQMAFLRGDPRKSKIKRKGPQHMCAGYITGLKPGEDYELQWAEADSAGNVGESALSVVLRETDGSAKAAYLQRGEPVTSKGEWAIKKQQFTATSPNMNVVFLHSVPGYGKSDATGEEITFLDDLLVVPVAKKAAK